MKLIRNPHYIISLEITQEDVEHFKEFESVKDNLYKLAGMPTKVLKGELHHTTLDDIRRLSDV